MYSINNGKLWMAFRSKEPFNLLTLRGPKGHEQAAGINFNLGTFDFGKMFDKEGDLADYVSELMGIK